MEIQEAITREDIEKCSKAIIELRPHFTKETVVIKVQAQQNEGYHLLYIEEENVVASIMGYRIINNLAWGKTFYIDDLSTLPEYRNKGYGSKFLEWAVQKARELGCEQLHLDTGFDRKDAHRLYLKYNFNYNCHHMASML